MATASPKTTSPRARALLKSFEQGPQGGFAAVPYDDGEGAMVIGWGHCLFRGETFTQPINRDGAERLFAEDIRHAERGVAALNLDLTQNEFDALVLWVFSLGAGTLAPSTLLKALRRTPRDPEAIARQWLHWVTQGHQRLPALVIRRTCELMLFQGAPDSAIADERARLTLLAARGRSEERR